MKITIYTCDKCGKQSTEGSVEGFEQIAAFCHNDTLEEAKILDFEHVCQDCRTEFSELVRGWAGLL